MAWLGPAITSAIMWAHITGYYSHMKRFEGRPVATRSNVDVDTSFSFPKLLAACSTSWDMPVIMNNPKSGVRVRISTCISICLFFNMIT